MTDKHKAVIKFYLDKNNWRPPAYSVMMKKFKYKSKNSPLKIIRAYKKMLKGLTNGGKPHVCGVIAVHNTRREDRITHCGLCDMPIDSVDYPGDKGLEV